MQARDSLPAVRVHRWMEPQTIGTILLYATFDVFDSVVRSRWATAAAAARFFWFTDTTMTRESRREITAATFEQFKVHVHSVRDPSMSIWEPVGAEISPIHGLDDHASAMSTPQVAPVAAISHTTGRSSQVQQKFRAGVKSRDGAACVLCWHTPTYENEVQAAHVVRHKSSASVLAEAELANVDDTCNGVMLCATPCHFYFDQLHWWIDEEGLVVVSDALLADATRGPHFRQFVGKPLRTPTHYWRQWPPPTAWAVQRRLCLARTEERHEIADRKPFSCHKCGGRWATSFALERHASSCQKTERTQLFTPDGFRFDLGLTLADDDVASELLSE